MARKKTNNKSYSQKKYNNKKCIGNAGKKDYPSLNLKLNGRKATASKTKYGYKWDGFGYEGSVSRKGKDLNIKIRKKSFWDRVFGD